MASSPEAARVRSVLESMGLKCDVVAPGVDAELKLESAEGRLHDVPGHSRAAVLGLPEPRDAYVAAPGVATPLDALQAGARVGLQGRLRREFLGVHRPDAVAVDVDGAREALAGLDRGEIDAWVASVRVIRASGAADRIL